MNTHNERKGTKRKIIHLRGLTVFHKILLWFIGITLVSVFVSGAVHYQYIKTLVTQSLKTDLSNTIDHVVELFANSYASTVERDLVALEYSDAVNNLLTVEKSKFYFHKPALEKQFLNYLKANTLYRSMHFVNLRGDEEVVVRGSKRLRDYHSLRDTDATDPLYVNAATLFSRLAEAQIGEILFEGPFVGSDGAPGCIVGIAKRDPDIGSFGGALLISIDFSRYVRDLSEYTLFNQAFFWIFDRSGNVLLRPQNFSGVSPWQYVVSGTTTTANENVYVGQCFLGTEETAVLNVVLNMPQNFFASQLQKGVYLTIGVAVAITFFVAIVAYRVSRQFTDPLIELGHVSNEIRRGNLKVKAEGEYSAEFATLADAINKMTLNLERTTVSKDYVDNIIDSMIDSLLVVDTKHSITHANKAACAFFHYTEDEIVGMSLHRLFSASNDSLTQCKEMLNGLSAAQQTTSFETLCLLKDGRDIPVICAFSAMGCAGGEVGDVVAVLKDISTRKEAEEKRVFLEKELQSARKLESIGTLAAGIAHEINTPIQFINDNVSFLGESIEAYRNVIQHYKETFRTCQDSAAVERVMKEISAFEEKNNVDFFDAEIPEALNQTHEGIARVSKIVNAMKDFSHMGSDDKKHVDINKAIDSTITVSKNVWKYVADMDVDFDETLPAVLCLVNEINQAIMNLIVNAAHSISDVVGESGGRGIIRIRTYKEENYVVVAVSDTGTGIDRDHRERIFDPFFTTKEVGKGTGQGLAIAYKTIVEKHQGLLMLESEVGKGTTFFIKLPIV